MPNEPSPAAKRAAKNVFITLAQRGRLKATRAVWNAYDELEIAAIIDEELQRDKEFAK